MFSFRIVSAFAAAALVSMASAQSSMSSSIVSIPSPTKTVVARAMETIGCFETGIPLEDHGVGLFTSAGMCQQICLGLEKDVLGLSDGERCWCGDEYPPEDTKVANSTCNSMCSGDDTTICGGRNKLWIMSTGRSRNQIPFFEPQSSSSSSSSSSAAPSSTSAPSQSSATAPANTAATTSAAAEPAKGPNTVGIAIGVVVAVLGVAAIIGGVFFYLRRQRRLQAEEDYRRHASVANFTSGGSSMTDSRLDPEFMARRQSNGSIADNEDYSRRILKVTNA